MQTKTVSPEKKIVNLETERLARKLYACYLGDSGGLDWKGDPCPTWEELLEREGSALGTMDPTKVRHHWYTVARFCLANSMLARPWDPDEYTFGPDCESKRAIYRRYAYASEPEPQPPSSATTTDSPGPKPSLTASEEPRAA